EALGGRAVGEIYEGQQHYRLQVRVPEELRDDLDQVRRLPVRAAVGPIVPLGQIATLATRDSPASISREGGRRRTSVELNVRGRDLASFVRAAKKAIVDEVAFPPGYLLRWGGEYEHLSAAIARLFVAVPLALLLIFVLLYAAFAAMRPTLLIYLNVPFA